jgi:hypothetical protein
MKEDLLPHLHLPRFLRHPLILLAIAMDAINYFAEYFN